MWGLIAESFGLQISCLFLGARWHVCGVRMERGRLILISIWAYISTP